jgi:hypothetical protein
LATRTAVRADDDQLSESGGSTTSGMTSPQGPCRDTFCIAMICTLVRQVRNRAHTHPLRLTCRNLTDHSMLELKMWRRSTMSRLDYLQGHQRNLSKMFRCSISVCCCVASSAPLSCASFVLPREVRLLTVVSTLRRLWSLFPLCLCRSRSSTEMSRRSSRKNMHVPERKMPTMTSLEVDEPPPTIKNST